MKKLLAAVVAMGVMSVSAFALDGKIGEVNFATNGKIWVQVVPTQGASVTKVLISLTADMKKAMIAAVLTAKSTDATVTVWPGTINGVTGWKNIILK